MALRRYFTTSVSLALLCTGIAILTAFLPIPGLQYVSVPVTLLLFLLLVRKERRKQRLAQRLKETEALLNTSLWLDSCSTPDDAVDVILPALEQIRPYQAAILFLWEPKQAQFQVLGSRGGSRLSEEAPALTERDIAQGEIAAQYISEVRPGSSGRLAALLPQTRAYALLPLFGIGRERIGLLYVAFDRPNPLTESQYRQIKDFAQRIAFPLQTLRLREQLQGMAFTDAMTQLPNYRAFHTHLSEEIRRAIRYRHPLSLLLLDLDRFKHVNDRYGHPVGDRLLCHLASVLRSCLRDTDLPARYGGEEFAVLCPETDSEEALIVAERIRLAVAESALVLDGGETLTMTISLGVATYLHREENEANLIRRADLALYQAKREGRNRSVCAETLACVVVTTPDLSESLTPAQEEDVEALLRYPGATSPDNQAGK